MKRILYIVPGLNPTLKDGASNRVDSFAKCFHQNGYKVYILALCYRKQYIKIIRNKKLLDDKYNWIIVPHIFLKGTKLNSLVLFPIKLIISILCRYYRCKLILADYEKGAEFASWTKGYSKLIVNYRGDSIDEYKMANNASDEALYVRSLKKYLSESVDKADFTICVSDNLKKNIENRTSKTLKKCFIFPCCADISRFNNISSENKNDKIILGYFGSLSKWQCIDEVIDIYKRLKAKDSRYFLLILTGSNWGNYKSQLDEIGDYCVKSISFEEMPKYIASMDITFALRELRPLNIVSSPTKLSESLASGVPVIVTEATGDYKELIINERTGIILNNLDITINDIEAIHEFCLKIKKDKEFYVKCCRGVVEGRTWNKYSKEFIKHIEKY